MPTIKDVVDQVVKLASEYPDCVYSGVGGDCCNKTGECSNGSVGCIVGQALILAGVDPDCIEDSSDIYNVADSLWSDVSDYEDKLDWLAEVQSLQDGGNKWGVAVSKANGLLGLNDK